MPKKGAELRAQALANRQSSAVGTYSLLIWELLVKNLQMQYSRRTSLQQRRRKSKYLCQRERPKMEFT